MRLYVRENASPTALDPFGMPAPADWTPTDPKELAALERWLDRRERLAMDRREREEFQREGNDFGGEG